MIIICILRIEHIVVKSFIKKVRMAISHLQFYIFLYLPYYGIHIRAIIVIVWLFE